MGKENWAVGGTGEEVGVIVVACGRALHKGEAQRACKGRQKGSTKE